MDHLVVNGAAGHLCVVEVQSSWDVRTLKARSLMLMLLMSYWFTSLDPLRRKPSLKSGSRICENAQAYR